MEYWDKEENRWINRAIKLFSTKPKAIVLYTTDGEITACKLGVSSADLSANIAVDGINPGGVLTDMHDDSGRGA